MISVKANLKHGQTGADIADLQNALRLLLLKRLLLENNAIESKKLIRELLIERKKAEYAETTATLVGIFQEKNNLTINSKQVDQKTAEAINAVIAEWEALQDTRDQIPERLNAYLVTGEIKSEDELPLQGLKVIAYHSSGDKKTIKLGEDTTDEQGNYTINYQLLPSLNAIDLFIKVFDKNNKPIKNSDTLNDAKQLETIDLIIPLDEPETTRHRIEGHITLEYGQAIEGLTLHLYRRDFSGKTTKLDTTQTLSKGRYVLRYNTARPVSLEIRAVDNAGKEVPLSKPLNTISLQPVTVLNLIAPASLQPLTSEYSRLTTDLAKHINQISDLADAKETNEQQDITILTQATGWDSRLIALAATTERLAADQAIGLSNAELYSLLRVGLPSDKLLLAQVPPDTVEKALEKARKSGIVDFNDTQVADIKRKFTAFANNTQKLIINTKLDTPLPGSQSTYKDLLQDSGLSTDAQEKFAAVYFKHREKPESLWAEAKKEGLDDQDIDTLKLQGKLAYLTGNSAKLTQHLKQNQKITNSIQLVETQHYEPTPWKISVLRAVNIQKNPADTLTEAEKKSLEMVIPSVYQGDKLEDRLDAYAEDLARKIRLNYPTQVLSHRIQHDKKFKALADNNTTALLLLDKATQEGFQFGRTSVSKFLKKEKQKLQGTISDADFEKSTKQLQGLQRLYQLTPNDESMLVLKELGINSASDVMAYKKEKFRQQFDQKSKAHNQQSNKSDTADSIRKKAEQITSVTSSMLMSIKAYNSSVSLNAISGTPEKNSEDKENLKKALKDYPTLESLFGSMDFCECEHCRSVLSPAAYLVDLLQFIDAGDTEYGIWNAFLNEWQERHGVEYLKDWTEKADGSPRSAQERKPYDALIERRPDLPHIALTCENTHTALPYIDLVNEILEYYVANDKLEEAAAKDTGDATTAELLAEPQNIIGTAYAELSKARYPLNLPFDLWLETVRQFCNYFETPLHTILKTFHTQDALFDSEAAFDSATLLFMESLGLSPAEVDLFTNHQLLDTWYELYGFESVNEDLTKATTETGQMIDLNSAKALSHRLGITYKELAEIVKAEFVSTNKELKLHDSDTKCNFDQTILQYADDTPVDSTALLRINLLVRLWRKLGWTIEETDRALSIFTQAVPSDVTAADPNKPPLQTALIYLAHLKTLDERLKLGTQSRIKLLALWADMTTTGKKSLYAQLFLNRSILKNSPVFDHPRGEYLTDNQIKLKDHVLALQGALGLTVTEITHILEDAKLTLQDAPLLITNVSILYRYGLLAKALKLSVDELITLKQLSGLDPFKALHTHVLTTLDKDYPFSQTLEFVNVTEKIKDSGLKIEDIDYWLRHRYDEIGKYRPNPENTLALLKSLAEGIRKIEAEHMMPDKSDVMSEDLLRKKLSLALTPDVVDTLIDMANTTVVFTAIKKDVDSANKLNPDAFGSDAFGLENRIILSYKEVPHKEQKLTIRGVFINDDDIKALVDNFLTTTPVPNVTQQQIFTDLLNDAKEKASVNSSKFFNNYLKKNMLREGSQSGFLQDDDFNKLFSPLTPLKVTPLKDISPTATDDVKKENEQIEKSNQEELQNRRNQIATAFLPFLRQRLTRQFIVETLTAQTGADPAVVESFITDERLIKTSTSQTLLSTFAAIADRQLTETFKKPITANCSGYLEVPATGAYRFYLELEKDAIFELHFRHLPNPVFLKRTTGADPIPITLGDGAEEFLELKAGTLYHFEVVVKDGNKGSAKLLVQGETLPKDLLSQLPLYSADAMEAAEQARILLTKSLQIVQHFGLSEREIRYLLMNAKDFDDISFSHLPTNIASSTTEEKREEEWKLTIKRFEWLRRLIDYARLKRDIANGTDDLIGIFEGKPLVITSNQAQLDRLVLIATLTRRDETIVKACATALGIDAADLVNEKPLWRLWKALQIIERFGVMPASLISWLEIVRTDRTNDQRFTLSQNVKETIKARVEPETWQRVAQPIFDKLRQRQRDALVSYLLHKLDLERMEQLYEHFLIDLGMEPVVQTSRIRLAISSVQLFIQRSLLNLERRVKPSAINSKHWEWMKRYRAWEANRKIFLFPENWLEPEFRDNKTHLFSELEGALLQGDVSSDLVEDAFFKYLQHFEELALLDICAMHEEDNGILHVFGRTFNMPKKYFYRRYVHKAWTPWEPISVQIEGDHLAPVVWRDRLYLFWVTFLEKPQQKNETIDTSKDQKISPVKIDVEAHLHWSEYMNGEWSTPEATDPKSPSPITVKGLDKFNPNSVFIHVTKEDYSNGDERGVYINLHEPSKINEFNGFLRNIRDHEELLQALGDRRWDEPIEDGLWNKIIEIATRLNYERWLPTIHPPFIDESYRDFRDVLHEKIIDFGDSILSLKESSFYRSFYLAGRNSHPKDDDYKIKPNNPFATSEENTNYYIGNNGLQVKTDFSLSQNSYILKNDKRYEVLSCNSLGNNDISDEVASLNQPFFYQDNEHAFFVEPEVTEEIIEKREWWGFDGTLFDNILDHLEWLDDSFVIPQSPRLELRPGIINPPISPINPDPLVNPLPATDWLINPRTLLAFNEAIIGDFSQPLTPEINNTLVNEGSLDISAGNPLAGMVRTRLQDSASLRRTDLRVSRGNANIVGGGGLNTTLFRNLLNKNRVR